MRIFLAVIGFLNYLRPSNNSFGIRNEKNPKKIRPFSFFFLPSIKCQLFLFICLFFVHMSVDIDLRVELPTMWLIWLDVDLRLCWVSWRIISGFLMTRTTFLKHCLECLVFQSIHQRLLIHRHFVVDAEWQRQADQGGIYWQLRGNRRPPRHLSITTSRHFNRCYASFIHPIWAVMMV